MGWLSALVLIAFAARALVPPGYMIAVAEASGPTIVLCPQAGPVSIAAHEAAPAYQTAHRLHAGGHDHHDGHHGAVDHSAHNEMGAHVPGAHAMAPGAEAEAQHDAGQAPHSRHADVPCPYAFVASVGVPPPILPLLAVLAIERPTLRVFEESRTPRSFAAPTPPATGPPHLLG